MHSSSAQSSSSPRLTEFNTCSLHSSAPSQAASCLLLHTNISRRGKRRRFARSNRPNTSSGGSKTIYSRPPTKNDYPSMHPSGRFYQFVTRQITRTTRMTRLRNKQTQLLSVHRNQTSGKSTTSVPPDYWQYTPMDGSQDNGFLQQWEGMNIFITTTYVRLPLLIAFAAADIMVHAISSFNPIFMLNT